MPIFTDRERIFCKDLRKAANNGTFPVYAVETGLDFPSQPYMPTYTERSGNEVCMECVNPECEKTVTVRAKFKPKEVVNVRDEEKVLVFDAGTAGELTYTTDPDERCLVSPNRQK